MTQAATQAEAAEGTRQAPGGGPGQGQGNETPTTRDHSQLPDPFEKAGITQPAGQGAGGEGREQEGREQEPSGKEQAGDQTGTETKGEKGALNLDPRQKAAAEHLGLSEEDLRAQVQAIGAEKVVALLDKAAPPEGPQGEEQGQQGAEAGEGFAFPDDLRGVYPDDAELLDAIESGVNDRFARTHDQIGELQTLLATMAARSAIQAAGEVASDLTVDTVVDKAGQLAGGAALQGTPLELDDAINQAVETLTSGKAAEAARAAVKQAVQQRGTQMTGAPAGRTAPPQGGAEAQQKRSLSTIDRKRQEMGLPPSM